MMAEILLIVSFLGILSIVSVINQLRFAKGASPSSELPFPYLVLMLLYAILFLVTWAWFGRCLSGTRWEKITAALIGATPLFVLSVLGYAGVFGAFVFNEINPDLMPAASVLSSEGSPP